MKKTVLAIVSLMLVLIVVPGAYAATINISNSLGVRVSIVLTYTDANSGTLTTRGWWRVAPGGETTVTVDADESRDIYYAAYNKDQFMDSSTFGNPEIRRWASPHNFTYSTDAEPSDEGVWQGRFHKINGSSVNIDSTRRR
ncbi:MAG: DUF1036 domain-containing protein [Synergistaceae bacterium]|jgi:uncharacterized membrane protein|nr:DUF1036 domain-containing protein [Synergistaceae bacterium]